MKHEDVISSREGEEGNLLSLLRDVSLTTTTYVCVLSDAFGVRFVHGVLRARVRMNEVLRCALP